MKIVHLILKINLGVLLVWPAGVEQLQAQNLYYSGSLQYATGSYYFTERTGSFYFSNSVGVSSTRWSLYVSMPLIYQNTPWISYSKTGTGPLPTGGPQSGLVDKRQQQGSGNGRGQRRHTINPGPADTVSYSQTQFGDPSLSANLKLWNSPSGRSMINANGGLKFPVADENSGFGTGAWDVGGGLSWSQRIQQHYLLMVSGMYWYLGDMDELDLNNLLSYSAALGRTFSDGKLMGTVSFMGSTEIIDDVDPPVNVGAGLNYRLSNATNLNTNILFGLTESASDFSIGVGWSVNF
ncbi:MAG: transporter [Bacteroidota bacterium]